ncbi:MAG TPA: hypothetical protein VGF99_14120 [Myxococcota bacterium]
MRPLQRDRRAELATSILRIVKRRVDEGSFVVDDAVDLALAQCRRFGGPRLADSDLPTLRTTLSTLATSLEPPTARALHRFAADAAAAAWALNRVGRSPGAMLREQADDDPRAMITGALYAELLQSTSDVDLVRRAVKRVLSERRRGAPGRVVPLAAHDPLRDLMDLPAQGRVRLPTGDVRTGMARAANDAPAFGAMLRQAAAFSRGVLEPALGLELWTLCRPLGFTDQRRNRVLVATTSSVAAQETQLRSRELLYRLKTLEPFKDLVGVKVIVDARAFNRLVEG